MKYFRVIEVNARYYVQARKRFLWFQWWANYFFDPSVRSVCEPYAFNSLEDAREALRRSGDMPTELLEEDQRVVWESKP